MEGAKLTTVLVVEDEAIIAADIQQVLTELGYNVPQVAATGAASIRAAMELRPSLVLMDIKLRGDMDGIEAARAIRALVDVPVVFLTSYSDEHTLERAKQAAPSGYLLKPFTDRSLRVAVEVALHKHRLEAKAAECKDWFFMTLKTIGDGVIATDPHEIITLMNPAAEAITGWPSAEARGKILGDVFRMLDAKGSPLPSPVREALLRGETKGCPANVLLAPRSGANLEVIPIGAPIVDRHETLLGAVLVFRDTTKCRELEHKVVLSERLASLGTMSAGIVHEINNPMAYVTANGILAAQRIASVLAELSTEGTSIPDAEHLSEKWRTQLGEAHHALAEAFEGAERVRRIIKSVGRFTRVEGPSSAPLELANVIDQAAKIVASQFPPSAEIVRDFRPAPKILGNEEQLTEVFMNLLVNAAHALSSADVASPRIVESTYTDELGRSVAEVRDNGCGIPDEIRDRIFEPFFTTKPVGSGTGLGLYLSHAIIAGLGGELTVTSDRERGTVFRIALPAADRE